MIGLCLNGEIGKFEGGLAKNIDKMDKMILALIGG